VLGWDVIFLLYEMISVEPHPDRFLENATKKEHGRLAADGLLTIMIF